MRYVALLRAINVGGNRIVKMERLRQLLEGMGLSGVKTYIQSGNAVFDAEESDAEALARRIETHLREAVGFAIPTTLRTPAQLAEITAALPARGESQRLYVHFLGRKAHARASERLDALGQEGLSLRLLPRELILLSEKSLKDKRLDSGNWLEKQLESWVTARNDHTVRKLQALAET